MQIIKGFSLRVIVDIRLASIGAADIVLTVLVKFVNVQCLFVVNVKEKQLKNYKDGLVLYLVSLIRMSYV